MPAQPPLATATGAPDRDGVLRAVATPAVAGLLGATTPAQAAAAAAAVVAGGDAEKALVYLTLLTGTLIDQLAADRDADPEHLRVAVAGLPGRITARLQPAAAS